MPHAPTAQPASPTPLSRRRRETFARLVQAARHTFVARGVAGSSVEEISEAAGFTRGAFYSNFADKDDLVVAVLRAEAARIIEAVAATEIADAGAEVAAAGDDVGPLVDLFVTRSGLDGDFYLLQTELTLYAIRERHRAKVLDEAVADLEHQVRRSVAAAIARIDREPLIDVDILVDALTGVFHHGARDSQMHGDPHHTRLRAMLTELVRTLTRPASHAS